MTGQFSGKSWKNWMGWSITNKADRHISRVLRAISDRPTNQPTNRVAYRVVCTRLKNHGLIRSVKTIPFYFPEAGNKMNGFCQKKCVFSIPLNAAEKICLGYLKWWPCYIHSIQRILDQKKSCTHFKFGSFIWERVWLQYKMTYVFECTV